ncbi:MAG: hypothetical protein HOQ21_10015 [Dermatophilaceae bacterium]|nr:hypothetical protein [Dermatophilaceae bacterium]
MSALAGYRALVAEHGPCLCNEVTCYGDIEDRELDDPTCLLCHYLNPDWPCPAEEDADLFFFDPDEAELGRPIVDVQLPDFKEI